jgi:sec-independent protein translocase protein TatB
MGNLGWSEMFFIVVFALIIFGPRRIPEIARVLGKTMAQLRNASEEFKRTWETEIERETIKEQQKQIDTTTAPADTVAQEASVNINPFGNLTPEPEASPSPLFHNEADSSAVASTVAHTVPSNIEKMESEESRQVPIA